MGGQQGPNGPSSSSYPVKAAEPIPVMRHVSNIYESRLNNFISPGQYSGTNLRSKLYDATVSGRPHIKLSVYSAPDLTRPTFEAATSNNFKDTKVGESFGPSWSTHWFKVQLTVPKELTTGKEHLELHWDANNEGMVWSEDGKPLQGLTGGGERVEWIIPQSFRDSKEHIIYIEMACNRMFGNANGDTIQPPDPNVYFQLHQAEIKKVNLEARALYMDFWILKDAALEFPREGWQEHEALSVANEVMNCFEIEGGDDECLKKCRKIAAKYLGTKVDSSQVYNQGKSLVNAIGHCHIDTCWLWPWAETKRKIARSWSNQCDLMDRYPEHRFCCSQAQQYKWLKKYYPSVFDRVKTKVKEGKFQPIGGSWVEHDTNMPSGESLVRQFLYGQRFFESHFGERSRTFWLPDTFGYSSQLPQLCRLAGMERFFTQKLSWNNINNYPHTTFNWVGIDNSQVLCHMAPAETYTAEADLGDVVRSMTQHKSKDQDATSLLPFGKGDGGGGPTWQQIEKLRRCRGISDEVGQLPAVKVGDSVDEFFAALEKKAAEGTEYVSWHGELYLELHRGCYTTQAKNKRNNRFVERMLHDVECCATRASLKVADYKYPKGTLDSMWEDVLLMQFHDCLPGSCIGMVYEDSDRKYQKVFQQGEKLLNEAMQALERTKNTDDDSCSLKAPNHSCYRFPEPSKVGMGMTRTGDDTYHFEGFNLSFKVSKGVITSLYDKQAHRELIPKGRTANQLVIFDDKPLYWQAWDVEVYHLNTRKVLAPSTTTYSQPKSVSDVHHLTTTTRISEKSSISTTLSVSLESDSIEFNSTVSWHETQKFLKVEFPTTIVSNNGLASYETQYGVITRPVHYNTSWDMAKFEVICHRFADLSDNNYGVSIYNDSKYGFAVQGSTMRLSLLRAPKAPDQTADMGTHHFRYAISTHQGPLGMKTVREARKFNEPLVAPMYPRLDGTGMMDDVPIYPYTKIFSTPPYTHTLDDSPSYRRTGRFTELFWTPLVDDSLDEPLMQPSLYTPEESSVVLDSVKRGEDDEDVRAQAEPSSLPLRKGRSVIVRVYEALGGVSRGILFVPRSSVEKIVMCNLLEDDGEELKPCTIGSAQKMGKFNFALNPFEVRTFRLCLR